MSDNAKIPAPESVENFPRSNHKARIVNDRGMLRVVERHYFWSKEKGRGLEKREYIGYVVDNRYYSNEQYRQNFNRRGKKKLLPESVLPVNEAIRIAGALDTRQAAEFPIYYAIARDLGLIEDLTAVWGEQAAKAILSIAFHWLHTSQNCGYLFDSWAKNKLLPCIDSIPAKEMTDFFAGLSQVTGWRKAFFQARLRRLPEDELLSYDATQISSDAHATNVMKGKGKDGAYHRQVGLILLVGHKTRMPVLFRLLPGNITDVTTVQDMLFRFDELSGGKRVFAAVVDRGYFSLPNIASFIDAGSRIIMAAKSDSNWIKGTIEKAMPKLWLNQCRIRKQNCWGCTVPCSPQFEDGKQRSVWVHVYRSDRKSEDENNHFYERLEKFEEEWIRWKPSPKNKNEECPLLKSPLMKYFKTGVGKPGKTPLVQDDAAIDAAVRCFGIFCNVTTMECTAEQALEQYHMRDLIETTFKSGKASIDMGTIRSHEDETMEGRFVISFAAMTILNQLLKLMHEPPEETAGKGETRELKPLDTEMTFNELKNWLETPRVIFDSDGNGYWQEVTTRQHDIARRLGYPDAYREIPDWFKR